MKQIKWIFLEGESPTLTQKICFRGMRTDLIFYSLKNKTTKCKENMLKCYSLLDMKVFWVFCLLLLNLYKFSISYLYFLNNLKDIKYHVQVHIISCKNFFLGNSFQRKHRLIATPSFCSNIVCKWNSIHIKTNYKVQSTGYTLLVAPN